MSYALSNAPISSADWHFWSTDPAEKDDFTTPGYYWADEGGFWAPKESPITAPVFRFYSKSRNHHFWTRTRAELEGRADFVFEGAKYHVFPSAQPGTQELYRYNAKPQVGDFFHHFWTSHPQTELLGDWKPEGSIGFVYDGEPSDPAVLATTEKVFRVFARPSVSNWLCRIEHNGLLVPPWGKNIDSATLADAQVECQGYVNWVYNNHVGLPSGCRPKLDPR